MPKRKAAYALWVAIPVLTTLNQACIKLLAERMQETPFGLSWLAGAVHTPWLYGILVAEALSFVLWMAVLAHHSISKAAPITALAYISTLTMSWALFREPFMPLQLCGSLLILVGVWLIGTASEQKNNASAITE